MGYAFTLVVFLLVIVLAVVGVVAIRTWRGWWRWIAALSLLPVLFVGARIVVDVASDPTSHNLWPFEVLAVVAVTLVALGAVQLVRMAVTRFSR